ncbi:hypothetical protein ACWGJ6_36710 [Streptomyces canus]|uniref:hypothetical protein n=1 Tax=Streptomyces canus TaxID=58343 RepID=UPI002E26CE71
MAETEKFETIRYTADVIALTPAREVLLIQGAGRRTRAPGRSRGFITQVGCRAMMCRCPELRFVARPTGIRPSRTSTTNWDAGHGFELVS